MLKFDFYWLDLIIINHYYRTEFHFNSSDHKFTLIIVIFLWTGSGDSAWLNKGSFTFGNVFSANSNSPAKATAEEGSSDEEKDVSVVANENEPHFEPIIPLPDLVESKTGEEEETVCEYSKWRY